MQRLAILSLSVLLLGPLVLGHSWVHCTKYSSDIFTDKGFDESKCSGYPRSWANNGAKAAFGADSLQFLLHDFRNGQQPTHGICLGDRGIDYPLNYTMASYRTGELVRIIWPAKNHGGPQSRNGCNVFHPDNLDLVFAFCGPRNSDPVLSELTRNSPNLIADLKATDKGFKNCYDSCVDTDRAACQGTFVIPGTLSGRCTFVWLWELHVGEFYTTCWEADVFSDKPSIPTLDVGFAKLNRVNQPIPTNGTFEVEVQWKALFPESSDKTVVVDVLSTNSVNFYGRGFVHDDAQGNISKVSVQLFRPILDNETVVLKIYVVPKDVFVNQPGDAWERAKINNSVQVRASTTGKRLL